MLDKVSEYTSATSQNLMAVGKKKTKKTKNVVAVFLLICGSFFLARYFPMH